MSVALKHSKPRRTSSSPREGARVNVFDEVFKRLEMIECTEIGTRAISYGVIFTGLYHGVGFEFNVYVNGQGRLSRKATQNPVWHKPIAPLDILRDEIDEVIRRVKRVEGSGDARVLRRRLN